MDEFYSNGKLLLTSEYVVLDGIECIALPTKFGQSLEVNKNQLNVINWESYDYRNHLWFREKYIINKNKTSLCVHRSEATCAQCQPSLASIQLFLVPSLQGLQN